MTDLDQRIHESLEDLVSRAPLPPSIDEITDRRLSVGASKRLPIFVGLAAAAVVIAAVVGAIALRNVGGDGATGPSLNQEQVPPVNAGPLPRLIVSAPDWRDAIEVYDDSASGPLEYDNVDRTVVYHAPHSWSPMAWVLTTSTEGYGLGDGETVDVGGREAVLWGQPGSYQAVGWVDGDETVVFSSRGLREDELLDLAATLQRGDDGAYELAAAPDGLDEAFRTDEPSQETGRTAEWRMTRGHGRGGVDLTADGQGPDAFWDSALDVLSESRRAEYVTVRGADGVFTGRGDEWRAEWAERDGTVAMRADFTGLTRPEAEAALAELTEVDEATWLQLQGPTSDADEDVRVFMDTDATSAEIDAVAQRLESAPEVSDAVYLDLARSFAEIAADEGSDLVSAGLGLPQEYSTSFRVTLADRDLGRAGGLITDLEGLSGVQAVLHPSAAIPLSFPATTPYGEDPPADTVELADGTTLSCPAVPGVPGLPCPVVLLDGEPAPAACPAGFTAADPDNNGVTDTCRWSHAATGSDPNCMMRDVDGDGEVDDCIPVDDP